MLKLLFWDEKASAPPPPNISLDPDSGTAEWRRIDGSEANAVVNLLSNTTLALEEVMPSMKLGEICFLPKVKVGGEFTVDVEDMRPITLLPELGKLVHSILAKRT